VALGGTIANVAVRAIPVDLHASSEFAQIAAYPGTQRRGPRLIERCTLRTLIAEKRCIATRCIVRCEQVPSVRAAAHVFRCRGSL
jgi:hypothetical protein